MQIYHERNAKRGLYVAILVTTCMKDSMSPLKSLWLCIKLALEWFFLIRIDFPPCLQRQLQYRKKKVTFCSHLLQLKKIQSFRSMQHNPILNQEHNDSMRTPKTSSYLGRCPFEASAKRNKSTRKNEELA